MMFFEVSEGLKNVAKSLSHFSLSLLFPKECVGCKGEGAWLCANCAPSIMIRDRFFCACCEIPTQLGITCHRCMKNDFSLDSLLAATSYRSELVRKLLYLLKYEHCEDVMSAISVIIRRFLLKYNEVLPRIDYIVPIPLHNKRESERGFNQAEYISLFIADALGSVVRPNIVERSHNTLPQVEVVFDERKKNTRGIFRVAHENELNGKSVFLVDDVYTTGATMQECARVLKDAGASHVHGFVIAKG